MKKDISMSLTVAFLSAFSLAFCQPVFAGVRCDKVFDTPILKDFSVSKEQTWSVLTKSDFKGGELIAILAQNPQLHALYAAPAGVWEGYSIAQHTLMVFNEFFTQFTFYNNKYQYRMSDNIRLLPTMRLMIALHDIGKPLAIQAGDKSRQHEFTVPILEHVFRYLGFSESEIRLAKAVVDNDVIGELVKGEISVKEAKDQMSLVADQAGMKLVDFLPIQFVFYVSDAAAYPSLKKSVFATKGGMVFPNRNQFEELSREVNAQ